MRILMVLFNMVGRGTYWRAYFLARSLAVRGHQIDVMVTSDKARLATHVHSEVSGRLTIVETPDLLWGPLRSGWDIWNALARMNWIRNRSYDLVHAFEARPVVIFPVLALRRRTGLPLVLDWADWFGRGGSVEERPGRLLRGILRPVETYFEERFRTSADYTTVINSFLGRRAAELGVPTATILKIPNGSNADEFRPIPRSEARRRLNLPEEIPLVGYIGAIFASDAALMVDTLVHLRRANPTVRILVAGYCNIRIDDLAPERDSVIQTGPIQFEQISLYLSACDVCWLPLRDSGANRGRFPGKLYDYMAVGRPVVVTDVGDVAEIVQEGAFGLVAPDEPGPLADRVEDLLNDPDLRQTMGERARHLAETIHHWDERGKRLEHFYRQILNSPEGFRHHPQESMAAGST